MFSRMGSAAFKKDLTNIRLLCEHLGNPQQGLKTIHIAGTNGKGSVSHMMAAVLQANGYKTGLYTSPHLYDFRERIRIDGQMVSEEFVIRFVELIKPVIEAIEPSFFEITVAMAFQSFAEEKVDVAIIEVGLGGRLDSTNIIVPELSIITNIGWDHMNMLGNSLQEIAGEKAGIIKPGIPVVIGESVEETRGVFETVAINNESPIFFAEEMFTAENFVIHNDRLQVSYQKKNSESITITTDLPGIYQVKNIRTVLASLEVLQQRQWNLSQEKSLTALQSVKELTGLKGRWEVVQEKPMVVLEVAHNKEGIEQMFKHIRLLSFDRLHIVFGMVKDKDADSVLSLFPTDAGYYFTKAAIPRALPSEELRLKATEHRLFGESFPDVNTAIKDAMKNAKPADLVIICGSIFLVAEVDRTLFHASTEIGH